MYDTEIANFKSRSAKGEIFNNELLSTSISYSASGQYAFRSTVNNSGTLSVKQWDAYNGYVVSTLFQNAAYSITLDTAASLQRAQISALGAVNNTDFDAGTFVAEWSKTKRLHLDLLTNMKKLLLDSPRMISKGRKFEKTFLFDEHGNPLLNSKGKPRYKYSGGEKERTMSGSKETDLANAYLSVRYGLLPLVHDLESACKSLLRIYRPRYTARGIDKVSGSQTIVTNWNTGKGYIPITQVVTRNYTNRVGIMYESDPVSRLLAGLGLTRPLSTAWELLPWSFVADWVVDIGSYLDAIQPDGAYRNLSAWVSTVDELIISCSSGAFVRTVQDATNESTSFSLTEASNRVEVTKSRSPWVPSIPNRPSLGSGLNLIRSVDAAALTVQQIRSKWKTFS